MRLTQGSVDLGADTLSCVHPNDTSMTCGTDGRAEADGCDDWRVMVWATPNAVSGNPPFRMIVAAGADCGETYRTCRSLYFADEWSW